MGCVRLLLVVTCAVLAVACGSNGPDVDALPEVPFPADAVQFTARPDIVEAGPLTVQSYSRVADDRIALQFETGTPECFGVDATVTENDDVVTVALRGGRLPEARDRMCIMIAVSGTVEVPLAAPLGDRTVTVGGAFAAGR